MINTEDYIGYALIQAKKYYTEETYNHVMRVATEVAGNNLIPDDLRNQCVALAIMHDLVEDTDYTYDYGNLSEEFNHSLRLLTKFEDEDYIDYIQAIRRNALNHPLAYWVKLADMKDHLMQTETLTDKLKEKYLKALPYLL